MIGFPQRTEGLNFYLNYVETMNHNIYLPKNRLTKCYVQSLILQEAKYTQYSHTAYQEKQVALQ